MKEAMISIASILNKHGLGTLYFGVRPNGDVVGQQISESSLRDVSRAVYESIKPEIYPVIQEEIIENKTVIRVEFSGENKPYSANGRYYLRTADEDREVTPEELRAIFSANTYPGKWELEESEASANQVDRSAVKSFYEKAIAAHRLPKKKYTSQNILDMFAFVKGDKLTKAGEILFGSTHPVTLKAATFATDEKLKIHDLELFEDNIIRLLTLSEDFIAKNIHWQNDIVGFERVATPEIPMEVIREVLANSFAHARYWGRTSHEISIHPSKIIIYSPGEYASRYKPEEYIKGHVESDFRNPKIAKVLYLNNSIEQLGTGFKRIDEICKAKGIKYEYENRENGFRVIIHRPSFHVNLGMYWDPALSGTDFSVLSILKQKPDSSRAEIADKIYKTPRTVQRSLNSLGEKGYIKRSGPKNNATWLILK